MKINPINTILITPKHQQYRKVGLIPNDSISINFGKKISTGFAKRLSETTDKNGDKFFTEEQVERLAESIRNSDVLAVDIDILQKKVLNKIDNSYEILFSELRPFDGYQFSAEKTTPTEMKRIRLRDDGSIKKEIIKTPNNNMYSWTSKPYKTSIFYDDKNLLDFKEELKEWEDKKTQSEIIIEYGENNEPQKVISTKYSPILDGAFEQKEYTLSNYPEDWDVLELIKADKLDVAIEKAGLIAGKPLAKVIKKQNGITDYDENYTYKGIMTNKHYSQKVDDKGEIQSYEYSYQITDENGSILLNTNRTWQKTQNGSITTINGEKYETIFDDKKQEIKIIKPDNSTEIFNIWLKTANKIEELTRFLKTLPADIIIDLNQVYVIDIINNPNKSTIDIMGDCIKTTTNEETLAHELGHTKSTYKKITRDNVLERIYKEETKAFEQESTMAERLILKYFLEDSKAYTSGLDEIVAETNAIMTTYGNKINSNNLKYRMHLLSKYFPKTIAKTAELLGYNKVQNNEN